MAVKKRNRAAQDTTLINLRALQKRVKRLEEDRATDGRILRNHDSRIGKLERAR